MAVVDEILDRHELKLAPDPSRTVVRAFTPGDADRRVRKIAERTAGLDGEAAERLLDELLAALSERQQDPLAFLRRRHEELTGAFDLPVVDEVRSLLMAAYGTQEYAFEAAALFNPCAMLYPDQSGVADGEIRFALSLRGVGEGHVSSVTFRRGRWTPGQAPVIDGASGHGAPPILLTDAGDGVTFTWPEAEGPVEPVLFPVTPSQSKGIEDLRMVRFVDDDGSWRIFGTYTAFDGTVARPEMLEASDLERFTLRPMTGRMARNKGMALFPRRIDGRFVMLGRIDNENIWLLRSDDPYRWDEGDLLLEPRASWEYVQIGNCGSPIEIDEGWLVLTHGVGLVRSYSIGAVLLDKDDPSRVLARTAQPLLRPRPEEAGGYVPNVVYSCGGLVHDRTLLLPYAVADQYTRFASAPVDRILAAMS